MTSIEAMKQAAAEAALGAVEKGSIVGVGTGSTVKYFINGLAKIKHQIDGAVASSIQTEQLLRAQGILIYDLNEVSSLPLYVDGADEFDGFLSLIKGGGGALTREKIIAAVAKKFICIVDQDKKSLALGHFPLAIEVIPMARSYVARQIVKLGGDPVYREGFKTDNGNQIIDVHNLKMDKPIELEIILNNIVGVVAHGLFAKRGADRILVGTDSGVQELTSRSRFEET